MKSTTHIKNSPPLYGWALATISLLLATACAAAGVVYSIRRGSGEVYEEIASALASQDLLNARQIINTASEPTPLDHWIYSERELITRSICTSTARDLLLFMEQLRSPKLLTLQATTLRIERGVTSISDLLPGVSERFTVLEPAVREQLELLKRAESIDSELAATETEIRAAARMFGEARNRFAQTLGLPHPDDPTEETARPQQYTGGPLKGLPRLPSIPDNLPDLGAMKDILASQGGYVVFSGPNAAEEFKAEMMSIQAVTQKALDDFSNRSAHKADLTLSKQDLNGSFALKSGRVQVLASELLLAVVSVNWRIH